FGTAAPPTLTVSVACATITSPGFADLGSSAETNVALISVPSVLIRFEMLLGRAAREDAGARFGVWAPVPVGVPAGIARNVAAASTKYLRSMEFPSVVPLEL